MEVYSQHIKDWHRLKAKFVGIDTFHEHIIYLRYDCHICRSEGLTALTRLQVTAGKKSIVATLNVVYSEYIQKNEAGFSKEALKLLDITDGDFVTVTHLPPISSLSKLRSKMYGNELDEVSFREIIGDIVDGKYSAIELAAFVTACAGENLSLNEITYLTRAMVQSGTILKWDHGKMIMDKHCVGGLPGNRTTPIIVSILAEAGLTIPKTSSKAITSPSGTADTLEVITNVMPGMDVVRAVVEKENGCMIWGGSVQLSPADDILISIEKSLDVDCEGQMIASVLSKKAAAGSTNVLIDIPVGKTAKVRSNEEALRLQYYFKAVGEAIGLNVSVMITDGSQPVGRGIGPALEAIDILAVLRNDADAPADLRERALDLAGALLDLSGAFPGKHGKAMAGAILQSGKAYEKFKAICEAQGAFREPKAGSYHYDILAESSGKVSEIDNRKLARIAKLAGAPRAAGAGVLFLAPLGKTVQKGDVLFRIYAEADGELEYAIEYLKADNNIIRIEA